MKNNFNSLVFEKRRKTLIRELPENSTVILPNKSISIRSNDVEYRFRSDSDFYYLTGFEEPNSICVLKKEKRSFTYTLFVEPKDREKETWTGKRAGKEGAKQIFKAHESYLFSEFKSKLKSFLLDTEHVYFPIGQNKDLELKITDIINELKKNNRTGAKSPKFISDPRDLIHRMRLIKDTYEIECLKFAARIAKDAHIMAMACSKPKMYEYEIEAIIEYRFRTLGAGGVAYPSIVGSGKNSTILHYTRNNRVIQKNDLILIDAGCEYNYYASDLTRTFPVNKKFNPEQKAIYEIVLEAQLKAIGQIKPGKRFIDSYNRAVYVLVKGLKDLGLLKGSVEKIIKKGEYKKFFMHKLSHWLGLDVHDAGPYTDEAGKSIKLLPGMVMTVEPGIYVPDLPDIPKRFRGIGIRIEDDVLVTKTGNKILTAGTPKTIDEIEAFN